MAVSGYLYATSVVVLFCFIQTCLALDCESRCRECPKVSQCALGIKPVKDECGCCKICPRQLHEECDTENPCDRSKNLYCSFGERGDNNGICVATPGRSCSFDDKIYLNGQIFTRGTRYSCTCFDSDIVCKPVCPHKLQVPSDCAHPRLVRKPGKACEQWICRKKNGDSELSNHVQQDLGQEDSTEATLKSQKHHANEHHSATLRAKCSARTTRWSPCSKTCGWGVSHRFTNNNKGCKFTKEVRLCQIRTCEDTKDKKIQLKAKRVRPALISKPVRYSFVGCKSKVFIPRYCAPSCTPKRTTTIAASFVCESGKIFQKNMMLIKSCSCDSDAK